MEGRYAYESGCIGVFSGHACRAEEGAGLLSAKRAQKGSPSRLFQEMESRVLETLNPTP